jgi:hypothetical protein
MKLHYADFTLQIEYNADDKPMKAYWASRKNCRQCVLKVSCAPIQAAKRLSGQPTIHNTTELM